MSSTGYRTRPITASRDLDAGATGCRRPGLVQILLLQVYLEALQVILAEIEREPADSQVSQAEIERMAAGRGIALIDAGKWKQHDTTIHFPPSWIRQILESFASGDLSLLDPSPL